MSFPILSSLILLPTIGSIFLFFSKDKGSNSNTIKYVALFTSIVNFLISIYLWYLFDPTTADFQFVEDREWIKGFVNYKVGVDGISILFIILTTFITPLCIISVNNSVKNRLRDFLIAILIMESFMIGVFCALDLVIFYLFFEAGLIPMFLIIGIWGGPRRVYSAFKFFLYTLLGSVLMLVAIISIYWINGTTDVVKLYELGIDAKYQNLLWLAFFSSFAVKTPMWPVHTWLPDAHVEAPTAGSVLLAAILLKMAGYGFIRFSIGLFPEAKQVLNDYENTVLNELDLKIEASNAIRTKKYFKGNELLKVPTIYQEYSTKDILVMEKVSGIPCTNIDEIKQAGLDLKILAENGVKIFLDQVFRDNFFHADMHPGNIFVSRDNQTNGYVAVDYAICGSLSDQDRYFLARMLSALIEKDFKSLAKLFIQANWVNADTDIFQLELTLTSACSEIIDKPLSEIEFGKLLLELFDSTRKYDLSIQPSLVLLQKTLIQSTY